MLTKYAELIITTWDNIPPGIFPVVAMVDGKARVYATPESLSQAEPLPGNTQVLMPAKPLVDPDPPYLPIYLGRDYANLALLGRNTSKLISLPPPPPSITATPTPDGPHLEITSAYQVKTELYRTTRYTEIQPGEFSHLATVSSNVPGQPVSYLDNSIHWIPQAVEPGSRYAYLARNIYGSSPIIEVVYE